MAASSLLTLIDDIATIMDDVAVLSKVAAKKTSAVLGDDLALNAEQVSGVKAERELPVVWAVTKGSFLNKLILVPAALVISAFVPWLINYLLIIGGLFLCYEGVEKLAHKFLHSKEEIEKEHQDLVAHLSDPNVDLKAFEKDKVKGAIRTDFVLSAEIIVIILGTVQDSPLSTQISVLSMLAVLFTVLVYGFVALIVKLDDAGLYMLKKSLTGNFNQFQRLTGRALLIFAPFLMKALSVLGTAAMFLVGGGILVHGLPFLHHFVEHAVGGISVLPSIDSILSSLSGALINGVIGVIAGAIVLALVSLKGKVLPAKQAD